MLVIYNDVIANFEAQRKKDDGPFSEDELSDRKGKSPYSYTSSERHHHRRSERPRE
jgi:hypothetical protein